MSTPVSSLLKLNYLLSYIFKLGGTVSIFTRPVMLAVCVEEVVVEVLPVEDLRLD